MSEKFFTNQKQTIQKKLTLLTWKLEWWKTFLVN